MANVDLTDLTPGTPPYHVDTLFELDVPGIGTRSAKLGDLLISTVIGPVSSVDSQIAAFDGTTGKLLKDGGIATSALLVSGGALGTPASGTATNLTGLPISTGVSGLGANVATFLGTPSSANLLAALTDKTGTGVSVFATAPAISAPILSGIVVAGAAASFNGPGGFARQYQWYSNPGAQWGRHSADTFGPTNSYTKSRHATVGSHTAVVADDNLVNLDFAGSDGTNFITGAQIHSLVDGAVSTGIVPGRLIFRTMNTAGASAERARLYSSGGWHIGGTPVDPGANNLRVQGAIVYNGMTYANRPGTPVTGMVINITDSSTVTWGATIAGSGANNVLARYNGTNWTVIGA